MSHLIDENVQLLTKKNYEIKHSVKLISIHHAAKELKMKGDTLIKLINSGAFDRSMYLEYGRDIKRNLDEGSAGNFTKTKFVLILGKVTQFKNEYKSLPEIASSIGLSYAHLSYFLKLEFIDGNFETIKIGTRYNFEKVREIAARFNSTKIGYCSSKRRLYSGDFMNKEFETLLNLFIDHTMSNTPAIIVGEVHMSRSSFSSEKVAIAIKKRLEVLLFKITWKRSVGRKILFKGFGFVDITDDELDMYNPELFKWQSFNIKDIQALSDVPSTLSEELGILKKFLTFCLMREEGRISDGVLNENWNREKEDEEFRKFNHIKSNILRAFNQVPKYTNDKFDDEDTKSVFLTREKYVNYFTTVYKTLGLKQALKIACGFILGLRRGELIEVAVEDFWIDENGYLKMDENQYGKLFLPAVKSKGCYSPSHRVFGTLIPPYLVRLINLYLREELYTAHPFETHKKIRNKTFIGKNGMKKVYENGHGYLFRPHNCGPERGYTRESIAVFISKIRTQIDFLNEHEKKYLSFHDGRHALNNWIEKSNYSPAKLYQSRSEAADLQMRHKRKKKAKGDVGDQAYLDKFSFEVYLEIIDQSINFPMDWDKLFNWEKIHGYLEGSVNQIKKESIQKENVSQPVLFNRSELEGQINLLKNQLQESVNRPANLSITEWLKTRTHYEFELKKVEELLRKIV